MLQPEVVPFFQGIPGAIFQQDNAHPRVAKAVQDICSDKHIHPLLWPTFSPIEHAWNLVALRLSPDPGPAASIDELWLRIQAIWKSLPQADIQKLFDSLYHVT